jgi:hypothetical protein
MTGFPVARLVPASGAQNTLNLPPPIPIHFQMSPDFPGGAPRGIRGMSFQVSVAGVVITRGVTPADGRVDVRVPPGGSATVQLLNGGTVVAEYVVRVDAAALSAVTTVTGQQERLRMLGYQIGHSGAGGNGVDGTQNFQLERSILDFQVDQNQFADGNADAPTRTNLTTRAGG